MSHPRAAAQVMQASDKYPYNSCLGLQLWAKRDDMHYFLGSSLAVGSGS